MVNFIKSHLSRNALLLGLCVAGVAAAALWSAAAGPIQPKNSDRPLVPAAGASAFSNGSYNFAGDAEPNFGTTTVDPSQPAGDNSGNSASPIQPDNTAGYVLPKPIPVPTPLPKCLYPGASGAIQPNSIYCPDNCYLESYPLQSCCPPGNRLEGAQIVCRTIE